MLRGALLKLLLAPPIVKLVGKHEEEIYPNTILIVLHLQIDKSENKMGKHLSNAMRIVTYHDSRDKLII